ncbi:hypothetical protein BROUX41_003415 [Berkeleyomyces rouxiae]|uniref:uncharacterized protein n=1 Tax=Berkeleyomyces rouxiae TaxID=2035830 RepID=UPI003B76B27A
MAPLAPRPDFPINFPSKLEGFTKPAASFIRDHKLHNLAGIACAAVVFDDHNRMLLLQRASHDSQPGTWESPGGGVDPEDPSLLHASARELWEEAGLVGTHIMRAVPVHEHGANSALPELTTKLFPEGDADWVYQNVASYFTNRSGSKILCALAFQFADVKRDTKITLDPNEHQNYKWVTEIEMLSERMSDGFEIPIAGRNMKDMLQQAFKIRRESGEMRIIRLWNKNANISRTNTPLSHSTMIVT